jgi:protein-tyrosine phosphatase
MKRFIDIHHHILYGLDDGPKTYEDMTVMLRMAAAEGIGTIIATPHVTPGLKPIDYVLMGSRLSEAHAYCLKNGLDLQLYPGAEVLFTPALLNLITQGCMPTLAGTRYVLLEFMPRAMYEEIEGAVQLLLNNGYIPILAHVERYRCFTRKISRLKQLKSRYAVLYQINCTALTRRKRFFTDGNFKRLLREGLIDFAATDAHNGSTRICNMRQFYRAVEAFAGKAIAQSLTAGNAENCFFR